MKLELPNILSRFIAKQIVEAMRYSELITVSLRQPNRPLSPDEILGLLFPEDSDNV